MKKTLPLLLLAALLCGCAAAPVQPAASPAQTETPASAASAAPAAPEPDFVEQVTAQAFAAAMSYHESGLAEELRHDDERFIMEATGWYAAWRCRTADCDLISQAEAEDFQRSLGSEDAFIFLEEMEQIGYVRRLRSADGTQSLDFVHHKQRMDELLGVELETEAEAETEDALNFTLIRHFPTGEESRHRYRVLFRKNPDADSAFAYRVTDVILPPRRAEMDPALSFDWELLMRQNGLRSILDQYSSVEVVHAFLPYTIWAFRHGESLCIMNASPDILSGQYRGCWFEYRKDEKGAARARVVGMDESAGSWQEQEGFISSYFDGLVLMRHVKTEDDLIHSTSRDSYGMRQDYAVDRGTLVLREYCYVYPDGEETISTAFRYGGTPPEADFLDGWDRPLRRVTAVWESFYNGELNVRTETVEIPADWEYLPWEANWGDYTVYMDAGYTRPYFYPGDGMDYTIYLSTAKG